MNQASKLNKTKSPFFKKIERTYIHSTIQILINFLGDNNTKNVLFSTMMKNPNEVVKHSGVKIYFSPVIKYSEDLFKEAKVPVSISTFTDQLLFKKLIEVGASNQNVPKYKTNMSVNITNHNIDFIMDLLFKEGDTIYIPFKNNYNNFRKYIIRRAILKTTYKASEKDKLVKDGVVRIKIDITVLDNEKAKKMSKDDFQRLTCSEKKKDILEHMNELFETTYKVIDNVKTNITNLNLPPTHTKGSDYSIANPRDPYSRDPYSRDPYSRDPYSRDPYSRDPYSRDPYSRYPDPRRPYTREPDPRRPYTSDPYSREPDPRRPYTREPDPRRPYTSDPYSREPDPRRPYSSDPYSREPDRQMNRRYPLIDKKKKAGELIKREIIKNHAKKYGRKTYGGTRQTKKNYRYKTIKKRTRKYRTRRR